MKTSWADASKEEKKMYTEKPPKVVKLFAMLSVWAMVKIYFKLFNNIKGIVTLIS